jgi:hypothetical protein
VAFDYRGRLITYNQTFGSPDFGAEQLAPNDVFIPLAQGSVSVGRAGQQNLDWQVADALETPAGNSTNTPNVIQINKLTGRARVLRETL